MIINDHGQRYQVTFYLCRECERELFNATERKLGLCLHCLEARLHKALYPKTLIVQAPSLQAKWN